ncbi:MAG: sugar ABC transporter substrate-binding protein [Lachnospiraceae bacterium]
MMKRKLVGLMMAMAMTTMLLAGCGETSESASATTEGSDETSDTTELKEYTMAVNFPESGSTAFEVLRKNMDNLEELTNGTFINSAGDLTPDGVLSFVESQVAAGVDGFIICPPSDSILPTVTQMCEEAGVYWGISYRSISDPEIKELVESSPYYVGNCYEDEETAGYDCGKWMGEAGYKKIAIISQAKGDTTCDTREIGLNQACEEFGIEIVGESRGHTQSSDTTAAVESFLAANAELDAVFFVGSAATGSHEAAVKAIEDAGRADDVKMITIDFPDQLVEDFESGILAYSYGMANMTLDPYVALIKVINAIQGTPINEDGTPTSNSISFFGIDDVEVAKEYTTAVGDLEYKLFDDAALSEMFKWENSSLDEAALQNILDEYNPL